jgi:hypothetical protein
MQSVDLFVLCMGWLAADLGRKIEHLASVLSSFTHDQELLSLARLSSKDTAVLQAPLKNFLGIEKHCFARPSNGDMTGGATLRDIHSCNNWGDGWEQEPGGKSKALSDTLSLKSSSSFMLMDADTPERCYDCSETPGRNERTNSASLLSGIVSNCAHR